MTDSLAGMFQDAHSLRQDVLNRARECARLVDPALLPPEGQTQGAKLPENYQSEGSVSIMRITGSYVGAAYAASDAWFRHTSSPEVRFSETISDDAKRRLDADLAMLDLVCGAAIETSSTHQTNRQPAGFRTAVHHNTEHVLVTGESFMRIEDNAVDPEDTETGDGKRKRDPLAFRFINFRRDQYVTKRDSAGDVLYHVVKERVDPLSLSKAKFAKTGLAEGDLRKIRTHDRMSDLHTLVEWQPWTRKWYIRQEITTKGASTDEYRTLTEGEEAVTPYVCTPYRLVSGEDYGRGLIERYRGDLSSLDELMCRLLQFAEMASLHYRVIDSASLVRPQDFDQPAGSPLICRVSDGKAQDVGLLKADQTGDFTVAQKVYEQLRTGIGLAKLSASSGIRDSERTTTTEVEQTIREVNEAVGGMFGTLADRQQQPMIGRIRHVVLRENILPPRLQKAFETGAVSPTVLTGIAAMQNRAKFGTVRSFVQLAKEIGEEAFARIDQNVLLEYTARMLGVYVPGLVLSQQQLQRKVDAAMAKAAQAQAIQQGIETSGKVIEQKAAASQAAA